MRKLFFYIYIVFAPALVFGQYSKTIQIEWSEVQSQKSVKGMEINYFSFDGALNEAEFGAMPLFKETVKLPADLFICESTVQIISADTLLPEIAESIADIDLIGKEIAISTKYNGLSADILILPFFRTEDNLIVRINEFEIQVDFVPTVPQETLSMVSEYATNSALSSGDWYKLGIVDQGIHRLEYDDLTAMGINAGSIDPATLGIFGNYNGVLSEDNSKGRADDLQENSIFISGGDDGSFDEGDYILFYANAARTWRYNIFSGRFDHQNNIYSDTTYYFLTADMGSDKRIKKIESLEDQPTVHANSFYDYDVIDNDIENLIYSGKEWYGERFTGDTVERTFTFEYPNLRKERPLYLKIDLATRAFIYTYFRVLVNGETVIDTSKLERITTSSSLWARDISKSATFFADKDKIDVTIQYISDDNNAITWLNYLVINAERELIYTGGQMQFMNPKVTADGNITKFTLTNVNQGITIWDVSDKYNPVEVSFDLNEDVLEFVLSTDDYRDFVAFDESEFHKPVSGFAVENQDLHSISSVNYIIISPEKFMDQATRLSQLHADADDLQIKIVTPEQIYNEFSSGSQDLSAIRDFMRMLWKKGAFGDEPGYLLMFGDASYDYKHRVHENNNVVPTYQAAESLRLTNSYVTDDFFGLLDDNEGLNCTGELDIGIGRFPVTTIAEATSAVDKIDHYLNRDKSVMRNWRNNFCFVADDADKNLHLKQANLLVSVADTLHPGIHINKLFSDAYIRVDVPGGKSFPEMNDKIQQQVETGALIINYTGHGGLAGWSEEVILDLPMIRAFENYDNLPLFITATCEFSRFDDPEVVSAGEYVFLNENGGGIGLLTTTRLAYAHANIVVNLRIYQNMIKDKNGKMPRLGDFVRVSKIPSTHQYLNFVLLGDPALRLAFPEYDVVTTTINDQSVSGDQDTIQALSLVNVSGHIADHEQNIKTSFNGYVYPRVFDKPSVYTTLGNDHESYPVDFELSDKVLFDGKVSVIDGEFNFSFMVPRDISYKYDFGKINYYAIDTVQYVDAWGSYDEFFIGGIDESAEADDEGPQISLYFDDRKFQSGELTSSNPLLIADITDDHGISFTGISLGRDITVNLNDDLSNSMILNDYFKYNLNSYQSGTVNYKMESLEAGWYTLSLKAWDLQNNSSTQDIDFYVDDAAEILLSEVINYPNPFTEYTQFGFIHNKTGSDFEVEIKIYDINGRYIGHLEQEVSSSGSGIAPIIWNGRDANGNMVPAGIYTYNIIVSDLYGNKTIQRQKMIKMNE